MRQITKVAKKAKVVDFRMDLGSVKSWGEFERSVALAAIIAYLVCPKNRKRRTGIYLKLLDGDLDELRINAFGSRELSLRCKSIDRDISLNRNLTTFRGSPGSYRRRLFTDLTDLRCKAVFPPGSATGGRKAAKRPKKFGKGIKDVLTAGLIVWTMIWANAHTPSQEFGPNAAKEFIRRHRKVLGLSNLFKTNASGLNKAWSKMRPVAHLAAALFHLIESLRTLAPGDSDELKLLPPHRFGPAELPQWRKGVVPFLEHAQWLAEYLARVKARPLTALRFPADLFAFPPEIGISPKQPEFTIGRPATFDLAFSKWLTVPKDGEAPK